MLLEPTDSGGAPHPRSQGEAHPQSTFERLASSELFMPVVLAALMLYFAFHAGGYFANTTGWATAAVAVAIGIRALAVGRPPRGLSWPLAWAAAALALFGVWALLSAGWSHAPSRALIEFDRVLLYTGVLVLFGTSSHPERTLRRLPVAIAFAVVVVCGAGLFARILPHSWPFALPEASSRMNWPLTYENAFGALAAIGLVMALQVASWRHEHPVTRVLAAAGLPVMAAALVLTFSRGGALAAVVGVVAYLLLCRSRGVFAALLAAAPFTYLAAHSAYDAKALATVNLTSPAAIDQGRSLAGTIAVSVVLTAAIMAVLVMLERRLMPYRAPRPRLRPALRLALLLAAIALVVGVGVAAGVPRDVYNKVVANTSAGGPSTTDPATLSRSQNRSKYWAASLKAFDRHPVDGTGAGTFGIEWVRDRDVIETTTEGHSLYLETLGELGIVGLGLLLVALGALLWPLFARLGTVRRPLYAGLAAATLAWLVHAGIDWDWEMPAVSVWVFAVGGCALAASPNRVMRPAPIRWPWRVLVAVLCGLAALTPVTIALSQDRLDRSEKALVADDCRTASSEARSSIAALGTRPEAYSIVAYCEVRAGRPASANRWMLAAHARDPRAWQYVYGLAVMHAAQGLDPHPGLRAARTLNPLDHFLIEEQRYFRGRTPRAWRAAVHMAKIPLLLPAGNRSGGR
jgi:hypothetical protein